MQYAQVGSIKEEFPSGCCQTENSTMVVAVVGGEDGCLQGMGVRIRDRECVEALDK